MLYRYLQKMKPYSASTSYDYCKDICVCTTEVDVFTILLTGLAREEKKNNKWENRIILEFKVLT